MLVANCDFARSPTKLFAEHGNLSSFEQFMKTLVRTLTATVCARLRGQNPLFSDDSRISPDRCQRSSCAIARLPLNRAFPTPDLARRDARRESRRPTWRREAVARSSLGTICQMQSGGLDSELKANAIILLIGTLCDIRLS